MNASLLATNIPSVSDTPWAVGGSHRNDFGSTSVMRVCMLLSGGACLEPLGEFGCGYFAGTDYVVSSFMEVSFERVWITFCTTR